MIDEHELVRRLRKERGWTMRELAERAGIHKATVFHIEHEENGTSFIVVQLILDACGLELQIVPKRRRQ